MEVLLCDGSDKATQRSLARERVLERFILPKRTPRQVRESERSP